MKRLFIFVLALGVALALGVCKGSVLTEILPRGTVNPREQEVAARESAAESPAIRAASSLSTAGAAVLPSSADWTRTARIATPYDYPEVDSTDWEWGDLIDRAVADGANVILDWSCASDGWECLEGAGLDAALETIRARAAYIHSRYPRVHYIMYIGPLEAVTEGVDEDQDGQVDAGQEARSLAVQHPDWAQVGVDGRPAVFYGSMPGMPFWVCETCEDVWLSPAHPEFRRLTLAKAARLAASGLDGLWFDVPFLTFDFGEGWQAQWSDLSPAARALFHEQTGLTLPEPPFTPDWSDSIWQAYVAWRYRLIREFVGEYADTVHAVSPNFQLIMETSVTPGVFSTQHAASPLDLPQVSDLTAHELGGLERPSSSPRALHFLATLLAWRHIDMTFGQPSWLLSYVEAGHPDSVEQARLHAAAVLTGGFNYYTSGDEGMSRVVDPAFRRELFAWIAAHEERLYPPSLRPYANVAVLYSQQTLDYRDRGDWERSEYTDAFYGTLMMLLESHIPFEVLSERQMERLGDFSAVLLPQVEALSDVQAEALRAYVQAGGALIVTGEEATRYDERGNPRADYALADLFGLHAGDADWQVYARGAGAGRVVYTPIAYAQEYLWAAAPWDERGEESDAAYAEEMRSAFLEEVWAESGVTSSLSTSAPSSVVFIPYLYEAGISLRVLNFTGLAYGNPLPTRQPVVDVTLKLPPGVSVASVQMVDFLASQGRGRDVAYVQDGDALAFTFDLDTAAFIEITFAP